MKDWIEVILVALIGCAMFVGAILLGIALVGGIALAFNIIPWLLWNHAVAPTFGWPQAGFWKVFFICWAISWLANLLRGGTKSK